MSGLLLLSALVQSTGDRASIESRGDSLAGSRRTVPLLHIRVGFTGYSLDETTKTKSHYDDAAREFEWAAELQNDWPYPWYGLGLAELAIGESSSIAIENIRQMLGKDYLSK